MAEAPGYSSATLGIGALLLVASVRATPHGDELRHRYAKSRNTCNYGDDGVLIKLKSTPGVASFRTAAGEDSSGTPAGRFREKLQDTIARRRRRLSEDGEDALEMLRSRGVDAIDVKLNDKNTRTFRSTLVLE